MRELKFRAWHSGNNHVRPTMLYDSQPGDCFKWLGEHQPITIMQFTGLKDSGDKDIFEGDILKGNGGAEDFFADVQWDVNQAAFVLNVPWNEAGTALPQLRYYVGMSFVTVEVVGHVYENYDLVKGAGEGVG